MEVKAFSNNDVAFIIWSYDKKIPNCLGFCIERKDSTTNKFEILPAWVGFKDQSNQSWKHKDTSIWPVQKFQWHDFTAERGKSYYYRITPMIGTSSNLKRYKESIITQNPVSISPDCGKMRAYFNRGILSTQSVSHQIIHSPSGFPNYKVLIDRLQQPGDTLRNSLSGQLRDALLELLKKARQENGHCYCALYELNDKELISELVSAKDNVHIILSNAGDNDDTNAAARQSLHEAGIEIYDRMLGNGHIGHNKFVVYKDKNGNDKYVLMGSTNWTYTGLCAQSNNALIIDSNELAKDYYDYWTRLKDDDSEQSLDLRNKNIVKRSVTLNGSKLNIWFSPNTVRKTKPSKNPATPVDMDDVFNLMNGAKKSILFLAFQPGTPSIIDQALQCQTNKPDLYIRGAATDKNAVENYNTELYHRNIHDPDTVVAVSNINDEFAFWQKELLKSSPSAHAIIHDKIVVIDAFTDNATVITGSHNLGFKASYANDENLLIIQNNTKLASAYAVHIMDIYDHYRWRYRLEKDKDPKKSFYGLDTTDKWQDKYFVPNSDENKDFSFWK
jgi:phosphatidylserine/phosphatidylglycerophosphate/cardiolipin synthase-like enzyme